MHRVLVIAEHESGILVSSTLNTIAAAKTFAPACIDVAVFSEKGESVASAAARVAGVSRVLVVDRQENAHYLAAIWAPQVAKLAADYTHVFAPATTFGKDLIPRVAALLGVSVLSDVIAIDESHRFKRPIYAGNAIVTVDASPDSQIAATIRTTAFDRPKEQAEAPIETKFVDADLPTHSRFVERRGAALSGPDLQTAQTVIAGGRGLGGGKGVELMQQLAAKLGAAIGASRAAVDSGWMANDLQVGQTGKIVAPELYIGIGISGAIQHLTGIKDSRTIVAINKDADAPLCKLADIVLVADLFDALPELIDSLSERDRK